MPVSEILPGQLWIGGDLVDFRDNGDLDSLGITHFVCVDMGCGHWLYTRNRRPPVKRLLIEIQDEPEVDISCYFQRVRAFIDAAFAEGGKVLVHCLAGISRSVSMVAAYLMMQNAWTVEQALAKIRETRPQAGPNCGFKIQLHDLQAELGIRGEGASYETPFGGAAPGNVPVVQDQSMHRGGNSDGWIEPVDTKRRHSFEIKCQRE